MNLRSLLLAALAITFLAGCGKDENNQPPTSSITGQFTALDVHQALATKKSGSDTNAICQSLKTRHESNGYSDLTISLMENGKAYECNYRDNWRNQCQEVGTFSGNTVTMVTFGKTYLMDFSLSDQDTLELVKVTDKDSQQELDLTQYYRTLDDRKVKRISDSDIAEMIQLFKTCSIFI